MGSKKHNRDCEINMIKNTVSSLLEKTDTVCGPLRSPSSGSIARASGLI